MPADPVAGCVSVVSRSPPTKLVCMVHPDIGDEIPGAAFLVARGVAGTVLALPAPEGGVMVITGFSEVWYPEPIPE